MKTVSFRMKKLAISSLLLIATQSSFALGEEDTSSMKEDLDKITAYLQNLGMYFGYDLTNFCMSGGSCGAEGEGTASSGGTGGFSNQLTSQTGTFSADIDLVTSFLGALLPSVPAASANGSNEEGPTVQLIPNTNTSLSTYASIINTYGGQSFTGQAKPFNSPNPGSLSVSPLIDQQPFQTDPVNQALLNLLATPDISYCINSITGELLDPCNTGATIGSDGNIQNDSSLGGGPVLSQVQVMLNTIGAFPSGSSKADMYPATGFFALPEENTAILPQLNIDSLVGPLMFDNTGTAKGNANDGKGLTAGNQIEQAANYIRYATGSVVPITQPSKVQYSTLYAKAINLGNTYKLKEQLDAQSTIANYLTSLRVYVAQTSVGISNLYYILSRRMPQDSHAGSGQKTSQALSEYVMATWRLQPSTPQEGQNGSTTWTSQINKASSATVQKEIAVLLAEINYQLYLTRVQQERLLLTNSTLLLQGAKSTQPNSNLNTTQGASSESNTGYEQPNS